MAAVGFQAYSTTTVWRCSECCNYPLIFPLCVPWLLTLLKYNYLGEMKSKAEVIWTLEVFFLTFVHCSWALLIWFIVLYSLQVDFDVAPWEFLCWQRNGKLNCREIACSPRTGLLFYTWTVYFSLGPLVCVSVCVDVCACICACMQLGSWAQVWVCFLCFYSSIISLR